MASIQEQLSLTFNDVLIRPQYSEVRSRDEVDISTTIVPGFQLETPVMSANMQTVNSLELTQELGNAGGMATIDQFRSIEEAADMITQSKAQDVLVAGAIGTTKDYLERAEALIAAGADLTVMDTPHAHNLLTKEAVKHFKTKFPEHPLIVGNIATSEAAIDLIHWGVDGVKVGVGPGAACLTRVNAGAGVPQISAIMETFAIAKDRGIGLIADGGMKTSGDFAKAIAAGGAAGYFGSLFAGTDEAPSELVEINGRKYKEYYGSSSTAAKKARAQKDKNYNGKANKYVEGAVGYTKYQGSVAEVVHNLNMGLKSAMSYTGASNISEFQARAQFIQQTNIGLVESGAHGVVEK